jgi:hypothetical protein
MNDHQQSGDGLRARMAASARRKVVCLIGSCRFYPAFQEANFQETMAGNVVLSVGFYPGARQQDGALVSPPPSDGANLWSDVGITPEEKEALDALHKDKIALADEVLVLNVGGYIGSSTRSELARAVELGRPVRWLVPQHCYTNGYETVVAVSVEHALAVLREQSGGDIDDETTRLREIPDDETLSMWREDAPPPSEACCASLAGPERAGGHKRGCPAAHPSKTCGEWARTEPPSVICSTEG